MKRILTTTSLLAFLAFAACNTTPNTTPEQITQTKPNAASKVLGVIEVEISSSDGSISSAKILGVNANGNLQAKGTAVAISNGNFVLTPGTSTYMTDGTYKYFQNTLSFNNKTGTSFSNLAMYPVSLPSSVGGTAFTAVSTLGGVPLTGTAASDLARATLPTHGMSSTTAVNPAKADLMLYTPAEAATVKSQLTVAPFSYVNPTVLEYGFLGRNLTDGRDVGSSTVACPTCGKGTVTWAFKFPLSLANSSNLGKFSFRYVIVNEPGSFGVQSVEEQTAGTIAGLSSGLTGASAKRSLSALGVNVSMFSQWRTLAGTSLKGPKVLPICSATSSSLGNYLGATKAARTLDQCFANQGLRDRYIPECPNAGLYYHLNLVDVQHDGKIIAAGNVYGGAHGQMGIFRLNRDGSLDTSFGLNGCNRTDLPGHNNFPTSLLIQPDGKIVLVGWSSVNGYMTWAFSRFNSDGSLDSSFKGPDGTGNGQFNIDFGGYAGGVAINLQSIASGQRLIATGIGSEKSLTVAAISINDGSFDLNFNGGAGLNSVISSSANYGTATKIDSNGRIWVAGGILVRYNANGILDTLFATNGVAVLNTYAFDLLISDGIYITGYYSVMKYDSNGNLDTTFNQPYGGFGLDYQSSGFSKNGNTLMVWTKGDIYRFSSSGTLDTAGVLKTTMDSVYGGVGLAIQNDGKLLVSGNGIARYNP